MEKRENVVDRRLKEIENLDKIKLNLTVNLGIRRRKRFEAEPI